MEQNTGRLTTVSADWLESIVSRLTPSMENRQSNFSYAGPLRRKTDMVVPGSGVAVKFKTTTGKNRRQRRSFVKEGSYFVTNAQQTVRGSDTLQEVYNFLKAAPAQTGAKSTDMIKGLKMPASTVYNALRTLQERGAIRKGMAEQEGANVAF